MSEELKPCPHCGSKGAEVVFDTVVLCSGCTAEAQPSDWNRRVVTQEQVEAAARSIADGLFFAHGIDAGREHSKDFAIFAFRAAGFEVEGLRHILPATISKLKTEE